MAFPWTSRDFQLKAKYRTWVWRFRWYVFGGSTKIPPRKPIGCVFSDFSYGFYHWQTHSWISPKTGGICFWIFFQIILLSWMIFEDMAWWKKCDQTLDLTSVCGELQLNWSSENRVGFLLDCEKFPAGPQLHPLISGHDLSTGRSWIPFIFDQWRDGSLRVN